MDAAVAALLGTGLGVVGTIAGTWLQQHYQSRRERQKMAVDLSVAEHEQAVKFALNSDHPVAVPPMTAYVLYHLDMLDLAEKGDVSAESVKIVAAKHKLVAGAFGVGPK